ncbi:MAG: BatA domain-containing protein [Phycisphaerae bacterium]
MGGGVPAILGAFVWPTLFWGGAAAVGAPILIHLFARRRFKRIRWAAIEFLLQAERKHRRRVRLEELILLALRCLAVLLIALLVARPFFRPQGLAALVGGQERTERIFIIDDSFSMGYQTGEAGVGSAVRTIPSTSPPEEVRTAGPTGYESQSTVFARAKRAVIELIELLRKQSPQDTVTVLVTSRIDRPIETGVYLDDRQTEELFARIEGLKVSQSGMSVRDVFQTVGGMIEEQTGMVNVAVYLVSDFQRKDWVRKARRHEAEGDRGGSPKEARRDGDTEAQRLEGKGRRDEGT